MEASLLLCACILSTVISASNSLSCMQCQGTEEKLCVGSEKQCPSTADACITTHIYKTTGSMAAVESPPLYYRYCGQRSQCSFTGTFTSQLSKQKYVTGCCFTSNCKPSLPKLPDDKTGNNGVTCKACIAIGDKACTADVSLPCTGDEKKCVSLTYSMSAIAKSELFTVSGCGTEELCKAQNHEINLENMSKKFSVTCNGGVSSFQHHLLHVILSLCLLLAVIS